MRFESDWPGDAIAGPASNTQGGEYAFFNSPGGRLLNRAGRPADQADANLRPIVLKDPGGAATRLAPRCAASRALQTPPRAVANRSSRQVPPVHSVPQRNTCGRWVGMLMSPVVEWLIKGFALSTAAGSPEFFPLTDNRAGSRGEARKSRPEPWLESGRSVVRGGTTARNVSRRLETVRTDAAHGRIFIAIVAEMWSSVRRWHERRRIREAWETIDDRTLRDIGLSRCEMELLTWTGYWSPDDADL